jgi:hypothetical protein
VPAALAPGNQPQLALTLRTPGDPPYDNLAETLLTALCVELDAWWGTVNLRDTAAKIALQTTVACPAALPRLDEAHTLPDPAIPARLGWISWFSPAALAALGNPQAADLKSAGGGVIVRVSPTPLDVHDPIACASLAAAYARFPKVGHRA